MISLDEIPPRKNVIINNARAGTSKMHKTNNYFLLFLISKTTNS